MTGFLPSRAALGSETEFLCFFYETEAERVLKSTVILRIPIKTYNGDGLRGIKSRKSRLAMNERKRKRIPEIFFNAWDMGDLGGIKCYGRMK